MLLATGKQTNYKALINKLYKGIAISEKEIPRARIPRALLLSNTSGRLAISHAINHANNTNKTQGLAKHKISTAN